MFSFLQKQIAAIDYGSHTIKGVLCTQDHATFQILRSYMLPVIPQPNDTKNDIKNNTNNNTKNNIKKENQSPSSNQQQNNSIHHSSNGHLNLYDYNLTRYIQSFFPELNSFILAISPSQTMYTRNLSLPINDMKQIRLIVPNMLEEELPIEDIETFETLVYPAYLPKNAQITEEQTQLISFSIRHMELEKSVFPLLSSNKFIDMLSIDSIGLYSFLSMLKKQEPKAYKEQAMAQIDMGNTFTTFNIIYLDKLIFTRKITLGGKDITLALSEILGIDFNEAEEYKKNILSFSDTTVVFSPTKKAIHKTKQKQLAISIQKITRTITNEFNRTVSTAFERIPIPEYFPERIFLSGGASLLSTFDKHLEEQIDHPIERYPKQNLFQDMEISTEIPDFTKDPPKDFPKNSQKNSKKTFIKDSPKNAIESAPKNAPENSPKNALGNTTNTPIEPWVTSIGLAWHYHFQEPYKLDYTNTPFGQKLKGIQMNWKIFRLTFICLGTGLLALFISLFLNIMIDKHRIKELSILLMEEAKLMPELKTANTPDEILLRLNKLCKNRLIFENKAALSSLYMIQSINEKLSTFSKEDLSFRFLSYEKGKIKLDLEVNDLEASSQLEDKLKEISLFSEVEVQDRAILPNKKIRAKLNLLIDPKLTSSNKECL